MEFRRDELPPALDLGHTFHWRDGVTYRVTALGASWVQAERVTEPGQKPTVVAAPVAPAPAISPPEEVVPAVPAEPAVQEVGEPIVDQAPATGGDEERSAPPTVEPRAGLAVDAKPAEAVETVKAAKAVEIADIPAEHDLASKADVAALAARLDALVWMVAATMAGTMAVLWKLLR
jgi:hypothetical protein